jgi:pyrroloquinoline quinone (PQQ) biosynthesis protein C
MPEAVQTETVRTNQTAQQLDRTGRGELYSRRLAEEVSRFKEALETHPMARLASEGAIPESILREYARIQYVDSVLWIPMLALIKGKTRSPRLMKAVRANILCEAGYDGKPHVTMAKEFVESLGEPTYYGDYSEYAPRAAHPVEVMNGLAGMTEAEMSGWLLAAETLVPIFFSIFRPAFARLRGVDLRYLDEHISVDADEHSQWMNEAVQEILSKDEDSFEQILNGVRIGGRVTLSIPDVLYARTIRTCRTNA